MPRVDYAPQPEPPSRAPSREYEPARNTNLARRTGGAPTATESTEVDALADRMNLSWSPMRPRSRTREPEDRVPPKDWTGLLFHTEGDGVQYLLDIPNFNNERAADQRNALTQVLRHITSAPQLSGEGKIFSPEEIDDIVRRPNMHDYATTYFQKVAVGLLFPISRGLLQHVGRGSDFQTLFSQDAYGIIGLRNRDQNPIPDPMRHCDDFIAQLQGVANGNTGSRFFQTPSLLRPSLVCYDTVFRNYEQFMEEFGDWYVDWHRTRPTETESWVSGLNMRDFTGANAFEDFMVKAREIRAARGDPPKRRPDPPPSPPRRDSPPPFDPGPPLDPDPGPQKPRVRNPRKPPKSNLAVSVAVALTFLLLAYQLND